MEYGYARVSSTEQNLDRQVLALQEYVKPENIVMDRQSGKNLDRPGYNALKGIFGLRPGDVLYIVSLDRLSRNKEDIKNEIAWFKAHKVRLMILDLPSSMVQVPENQEWIIDMKRYMSSGSLEQSQPGQRRRNLECPVRVSIVW